MMQTWRLARCCLLVFLSCAWSAIATTNVCAVESPEYRLAEALRERRLFELAERVCRDRLVSPALPAREQAMMAEALLRTIGYSALELSGEAREKRFAVATQFVEELLRAQPDHPYRAQLMLQDALSKLAHGEAIVAEHSVSARSAGIQKLALDLLRAAESQLEELSQQLARAIPQLRRNPPAAGSPTADELFALTSAIGYHQARASLLRSELYASESPDRRALVLSSRETLENVLTQMAKEDPLRASAMLDLARAKAQLGEIDEALQIAAEVDQPEVQPALRLAARGEMIRLNIARNPPRFADPATIDRQIDSVTSAELDEAILELYLAMAAALESNAEAQKKITSAAADWADKITAEHGAYWGRRADGLLLSSLPRASSGTADLLARSADRLYLQGSLDEARAAYEQAASGALEAGDRDAAFALWFKASLVDEKQQKHREAATRLLKIAMEDAAHDQAATAHLRGMWNLAQVARSEPSLLATYRAALDHHLRTWPTDPSTQQAAIWRLRIAIAESDLAAGIAASQVIPRESEMASEASLLLASCCRAAVATAKNEADEIALAKQGVAALESRLLGAARKLPEAWSAADRELVLTAAELLITYMPDQQSLAESMLAAAARGMPAPDDAWNAARARWQLVAVASDPQRAAEAMKLVAQLPADGSTLARLLATLASFRTRGEEHRRQLAEVRLAVIAHWKQGSAKLSAAEELLLARQTAEALVALDKRAEALALYENLARQQPQDAEVQEGLATLLLDSTDRASLERALAQWRIVASKSRPRTERWFRAKHRVATAQLRLGDKAGAKALAAFLLASPPGLEGTSWKQAFEQIVRVASQ